MTAMLRLFRLTSPVKSQPQQKPEARTLAVSHGGTVYTIALKRVASARRYTLRLRTAKQDLVLTMPARGSLRAAQDFAERHAGWIAEKMQALPRKVEFVPGILIPLRGIDHLIVHAPQARGTVAVRHIDGQPQVHVAGEAAHLARRLHDFLRREARKDLVAASARHAAQLDLKISSLTLKDTASRWGSCSSRGALNFSWRLIFAPPHVLDYLAAHEVAHLRHLDHSAAFWALTRHLCPGMDEAELWLKRNGSSLHRFGK